MPHRTRVVGGPRDGDHVIWEYEEMPLGVRVGRQVHWHGYRLTTLTSGERVYAWKGFIGTSLRRLAAERTAA